MKLPSLFEVQVLLELESSVLRCNSEIQNEKANRVCGASVLNHLNVERLYLQDRTLPPT